MIQTILIPTDFSATAQNAALYAVSLAKQSGTTKIVLYHSFATINLSPPLQGFDKIVVTEPFEKESADKLHEFEAMVRSSAGTIEVSSFHSAKKLSDGIDEVCEITKPDLIVMGITGGGILKEKMVGSNSVTIAKHTNVPVLIVPTDTMYTPIDKTLLVTDFIDVESTIPVASITSILEVTSSKLHVLHVPNGDNKINAIEKEKLMHLFAESIPEYHVAEDTGFEEAIEQYVNEHRINLIIIVPKERGIIESLFTKSHTKALAFHTKCPLLVTHY